MKKMKMKKGFSIIELIFVIAVIGILAAVAVPKLLDSRSGAIVSTVKQDISTITSSIQSYYMLNNGITNISDSVNINESTWKVESLQTTFSSSNKECVKIQIDGTQLKIIITKSSSTLCQKIYDAGIRNVTYELL